ncbi:MAG: KilA-N domain-containing protein [Acinetobacter sp.]
MNANLSICSKSVRIIDGLYSLNDLHKAAGGEDRHRPVRFMRLEQTKELVQEISEDQMWSSGEKQPVKTVHGGPASGTYTCKELVCAYAMWINPKFYLTVIRTIMSMNNQVEQLSLSEPTEEPVNRNPFFLTREIAGEFDARLRSLFDLTELMKGDSSVVKIFQRQARDLNHFMAWQEKNNRPA